MESIAYNFQQQATEEGNPLGKWNKQIKEKKKSKTKENMSFSKVSTALKKIKNDNKGGPLTE